MKHFIKACLALIMLLHTIVFNSNSQSFTVEKFRNIVPPSPTASSLGKYAETPVSLYTGTVNIEVPLYEIKVQDFSLPISLSYHSSGIKVEDIASWVGLGWSLNAGGVITRAMVGMPDDYFDFIKYDYTYYPELVYGKEGYLFSKQIIADNNYDLEDKIKENGDEIDLQPDIFYFNFGGYTGKFIFDEDGTPHIVAQKDFTVSYSQDGNGKITGFTFITDNGTKWLFTAAEETENHSTTTGEGIECTDGGTNIYSFRPRYKNYRYTYNSSWYLTQVTTRTGIDISFTYGDEDIVYDRMGSSNWFYQNFGHIINQDCNYASSCLRRLNTNSFDNTKAKKLQSIEWMGNRIEFEAEHERDDVSSDNNFALTKIKIYNKTNELIKGYWLDYDYFVSNDYDIISEKYRGKRLKLKGVHPFDSNELLFPPYSFEYNTTNLPNRFSEQVDFWGYYKPGASLKPKLYIYPDYYSEDLRAHHTIFPLKSYTGQELILDGSDRMSDETSMKAAILEKISYPTGGYTRFEYSVHEFENPQGLFDFDDDIKGGGLRINRRIHSDGNTEQITNYSYDAGNNTSGKIITLPQHGYYYIELVHCAIQPSPGHPFNTAVLSHSMGGLGRTKGNYVGYSKVTESRLGNGYSVYNFSLPATYGVEHEDYINGEYLYNKTKVSAYYANAIGDDDYDKVFESKYDWPFPPNPNYDWNRGFLEEEVICDESGKKVKRVVNTYNIKDFEKIKAFSSGVAGSISYRDANGQWLTNTGYSFAEYYYISAWKVLNNKTEYIYNQNDDTKYLTKSTDFYHDSPNHRQQTSIVTTGSDEKELKTEFRYPNLFTGDLHTYSMAHPANNIVNQPIEVIKYKDNKVISTTINHFNCYDCNMHPQGFLTGGRFLSDKTYQLETNVPLSDYQPVAANFTIDPRCKQQLSIDSYDGYGNLTQYHKINDINKSYVWGYDGEYPVIVADNISATALNTTVNSIQSNIEDFLENTISDITTSTQKAAWETFNILLRNHASLQNTFIKTYTYKPLVGITSETDIAGRTTYYEYDNFNRLNIIRDHDGNILKKYEYHYKNQ